MPEIGRRNYHITAARLFEDCNLIHDALVLCKFLPKVRNRTLLIDVAGKNLPYFGSRHDKAFIWKTHLKKVRVERLKADARRRNAERWLAFCYTILDDRFKSHFRRIASVNGNTFGMELIEAARYE
jgi:uncharacterized membrane protein YgdD (TMEM256/DUF423 family)